MAVLTVFTHPHCICTCVGVGMCWVSTIHSHISTGVRTRMHTRIRVHACTHTPEQRIQLRSAAHPRLSNILSAQPKNHNWTLWEALIQSTVTMLSETKSTACSQHINSQLTLSPYRSFSISLSLLALLSLPQMCEWTSKCVAKADLLYTAQYRKQLPLQLTSCKSNTVTWRKCIQYFQYLFELEV